MSSESVATGTSGSPTITAINNTIKNIGYIALCISILLFLIIKILKYMLARKKFRLLEPYGSKLNRLKEPCSSMSLSQLNTPISKSPLNRSFTP